MYRGDVEGMVSEKSVRMKPVESECFVPDFLIFQMTCRHRKTNERLLIERQVEFYGKNGRSVKTNLHKQG